MSTKFYGLTGGIGAGKSTVAKLFTDLNVPTLDLDRVGRTLLNKPDIQKYLVETFGKTILKNNSIDRKELGAIAFQSKASTQKLNAIMHPAIVQAEMKWRDKQTAPYAIIEASVLVESGDIERMDGLIVVIADIEVRKQRVLERGKQSELQIEHIIQRQCHDKQRLYYADYILDNHADLQQLSAQVKALHQQLLRA